MMLGDGEVGSETKREKRIKDNHNHPRYIIYDFETDTHTLTHIPNHVEVSVLKVSDDHSYDNSLVNKRTFPGYGCESAFLRVALS